ncbi:MAG: N-acetyltransferase [Bryobacteraceae bacterium]|nr:N-acetyltransferase [Bryobacteraceae bacterium]
MTLREPKPADFPAIAQLTRRAFDGFSPNPDYEVALLDRLRAPFVHILELIVEEHHQLRGHILFSRLQAGPIRAAALGPLSVDPDHQRRGIGSLLIRHGHSLLADRGYELVIVLGHPDYYPRFGFSADLADRHLRSEFSGSPEFMALELSPGALPFEPLTVTYPSAWH